MELKIRIKEVEEEVKLLTIEERCMRSVVINPNYNNAYRDEVGRHLDEIGFVKRVYDGNVTGLFRTETIRDATQEEIIAWYCIQSHIVCLTTDAATCRACPKNRGSNQCKMLEDYFESKKILKDKEIILELV